MPYSIGIDLGTQRCIGMIAIDGGKPEILDIVYRDDTQSSSSWEVFALSRLHRTAQAKLQIDQIEAVLTINATSNDEERVHRKQTADSVGWKARRLINQPTAACIGLGLLTSESRRYIVCDLGASSMRLTLLEVGDEVAEVLATDHHPDWCDEAIEREWAADLQRIRAVPQTLDVVPLLGDVRKSVLTRGEGLLKTQENKELTGWLASRELETTLNRLVANQVGVFYRLCDRARVKLSDIDKVVVIGGYGKYKSVQETVERLLQRPVIGSAKCGDLGCRGALAQAEILNGTCRELVSLVLTANDLWVQCDDEPPVQLVPKYTCMPFLKEVTFEIPHRDRVNRQLVFFQSGPQEDQSREMLGALSFTHEQEKSSPTQTLMVECGEGGLVRVSLVSCGSLRRHGCSFVVPCL